MEFQVPNSSVPLVQGDSHRRCGEMRVMRKLSLLLVLLCTISLKMRPSMLGRMPKTTMAQYLARLSLQLLHLHHHQLEILILLYLHRTACAEESRVRC
jgi:hypothetical protein